MEDWANGATPKFDKQNSEEQQKRERAIQERKILVEQAPVLWGRVQQGLRTQAQEFNQREGKEVLVAPLGKSTEMTMFAKLDGGQRELAVIFHDYGLLEFYAKRSNDELSDRSGHFDMSATSNNGLVLFDEHKNERSAEAAIGEMLNALMGWK